ncbi:MAG: UbiA prenyltransferase family protein [candidate division Zixibacteria bacterium]|nr:UbiA prenyltransferase family protein [candidate division Zixibacteria bacterium]
MTELAGNKEVIHWPTFLKAYVKSMRLYYAFVTGIAGWIGVSFYDFCAPGRTDYFRKTAILLLLFLSWGINQIINDFLGLPEDRVNAPRRPMVTGELQPILALKVSIILLLGVIFVTWFLSPWATIPLLAGILLNVFYEYAKGWSIFGNVVFGLSISMCTVYGFLASGPPPVPVITTNRVSVVLLVAILNGVMTYFTYFKDYEGDRIAGKRTFIVHHGLQVSRFAGVLGAFLPTGAFFFFLLIDWISKEDILYSRDFVFCGLMTIFLQLWTAVLFFRHPYGERTYFSLVTNIRACVAGQIALIAIFNGSLALYLFSASYVFIGFLFDLYKDSKS